MKNLNLPALKGTEKQITWATKLRQTAIEELGRLLAPGKMTVADLMAMKNAPGEAAIAQKLLQKDNAPWWIDNRSLYIKELIKKL